MSIYEDVLEDLSSYEESLAPLLGDGCYRWGEGNHGKLFPVDRESLGVEVEGETYRLYAMIEDEVQILVYKHESLNIDELKPLFRAWALQYHQQLENEI